jgi:16S rRNA (guanine966-N2)-methyltransferase
MKRNRSDTTLLSLRDISPTAQGQTNTLVPPLRSRGDVARRQGGSSSIRIIGGQWKRSVLPVPPIEGLRPTPNRVRETLFNWLGQDLTGLKCVDAFAGTGALGFEAASRGAAMVLMCERDPLLERALIASRDRLGAKNLLVQRGDALAMLASLPAASQDVIFLDPPFAQTELFLPAIKYAARSLKQGGWIYLESNRLWQVDEFTPLSLVIHKQGKAGLVHFYLLNVAN